MRTRLIKMKVLASTCVLVVLCVLFCLFVCVCTCVNSGYWTKRPNSCVFKLPFFCSSVELSGYFTQRVHAIVVNMTNKQH